MKLPVKKYDINITKVPPKNFINYSSYVKGFKGKLKLHPVQEPKRIRS